MRCVPFLVLSIISDERILNFYEFMHKTAN